MPLKTVLTLLMKLSLTLTALSLLFDSCTEKKGTPGPFGSNRDKEATSEYLILGGTKATITKTYSEVIFAETLPSQMPYGEKPKAGHPLPNDIDAELVPAQSAGIPFPTVRVPLTEIQKAILDDRRREPIRSRNIGMAEHREELFVIGWIEYLDEAPTPRLRRMGFCRKHNFITKRFQREPDEDYEYDD